MLQENTAESCSSLMFLHLQPHTKWFCCYLLSAFSLLSIMSYSLGTISIYIMSFTTSPTAFIVTAQDLLQLAECVWFLLTLISIRSHLEKQATKNRTSKTVNVLVTQSTAGFLPTSAERCCGCATLPCQRRGPQRAPLSIQP